MYTKKQLNRALKTIVHKVKDVERRIHFKTVYIDKKQKKHEHQVIFIKNKSLLESFNCDCRWCSFYGVDKKTNKLTKLCSNSLAVGLYLKIPEIESIFGVMK